MGYWNRHIRYLKWLKYICVQCPMYSNTNCHIKIQIPTFPEKLQTFYVKHVFIHDSNKYFDFFMICGSWYSVIWWLTSLLGVYLQDHHDDEECEKRSQETDVVMDEAEMQKQSVYYPPAAPPVRHKQEFVDLVALQHIDRRVQKVVGYRCHFNQWF